MGTKTITLYVSDIDQSEIPAGQAYQLSIRHPDVPVLDAEAIPGRWLQQSGRPARRPHPVCPRAASRALALAGVPVKKEGVQAALGYLAECRAKPARAAA